MGASTHPTQTLNFHGIFNFMIVWLTFPKSKSPRGDRAHAVGKLSFQAA
ncbi:hypothetical protein [Alysiella crassa]|nr:hypothetical protein [Alysiella crassa]UOP06451.1 hypothetical protein LVJ80_11890 [Alysiella crassa]